MRDERAKRKRRTGKIRKRIKQENIADIISNIKWHAIAVDYSGDTGIAL